MTKGERLQMLRQELKEPFKTKGDLNAETDLISRTVQWQKVIVWDRNSKNHLKQKVIVSI